MSIRSWIAALFAAGLSSTVLAQAPAGGEGQVQIPDFASNKLVGRLALVDRARHTIVIDDQGKPQPLTYTDNAPIFYQGRLGSISDLKEGQNVRAAFEVRGGEKRLRWLDVTSSEPPAPAPESVAPTPTPSAQPITGTVLSVDRKHHELVLYDEGFQRIVGFAPTASVMKDGKEMTIDALKRGDQVRATLNPGETTVTRIEATSGSGAPPKSH